MRGERKGRRDLKAETNWGGYGCQLLHVHAEVGGNDLTQREIDFVVNRPGTRVYVQSAWAMPDDDKRELKAFSLTGDSFRKIVVRNDIGRPWQDERGVLHVGLCDFLLDETLLG